MSEWVIQNSYLKTKEGLKNLGVMNTHKELDQTIVGQLAAIGEYLVINGIDKVNIGPGMWMTHSVLKKEKIEYLKAIIEQELEHQ